MALMAKSPLKLPVCPPKAPLTERPLLGMVLASELAQVFEVLASDISTVEL